MSESEEQIVELALPLEIANQPNVAQALDRLSTALAAQELLIDNEVEGFSFAKTPLRVDTVTIGKGMPGREADKFLCLGDYWDEETSTQTCTIQFN